MPGALADEIDFGFGDSLHAATEAKDNLVGKAMRDYADGVAGCIIGILLAEHLR